MPDTLLVSPCEASPAGDTVRSLVRGYIVNTSCVEQHKRLLERQREYKQKVEGLYNGST